MAEVIGYFDFIKKYENFKDFTSSDLKVITTNIMRILTSLIPIEEFFLSPNQLHFAKLLGNIINTRTALYKNTGITATYCTIKNPITCEDLLKCYKQLKFKDDKEYCLFINATCLLINLSIADDESSKYKNKFLAIFSELEKLGLADKDGKKTEVNNYRLNREGTAKWTEMGFPNPTSESSWVEFASRTPNLYNSGNTCYMNSFLQAINATTSFRNYLIKHTEQCKKNPVIKSLRDTLILLSSGIKEKKVNIEELFCESVWELLIEQDIQEERVKIKRESPPRDLTPEEIIKIRYKKMQSQRDSIESLLKIISIINSPQCNTEILPELDYLLIIMNPAVGEISLQNFLENQKKTAIEDKNRTLHYNIKENKEWAKKVLDALNKGGKIDDFQYSDNSLLNYIPITILKDATVETLQKFMDTDFTPVTENDFQDVETKRIKYTLLQRNYVPFIIIQNFFNINTKNNGLIIIEGQTFILKAAIIKSGSQRGGHYWTVTHEGCFDDLKPEALYDPKYMEKIIKDGTFEIVDPRESEIKTFQVYAYFFENIDKRGGGYLKNKPYLSGGESMKDKYFHKYLKYKNKYLELSKLKSQKIGRY